MKKRIGLIGYGGICSTHVKGYDKSTDIAEVTAVCDIRPERLQLAKEKYNLPDSALFEDYHDLINSGLVDAVDICTPNHVHCPAAAAAAEAGLDFSVEKPVGLNLDEVVKLNEIAKKNNVKSFVCLSYRYMAPIRYMKHLIDTGKIGKIRHINITFFKDSGLWEGRPLEWRFIKEQAGTGVLGDLGVHLIDAVRFFGEDFEGVFAQTGITVKERKSLTSDEMLPVGTDDWCNMAAMTKSGATVMMTISRVATTVSSYVNYDIIGEKGRISHVVGVDAFGQTSSNAQILGCFEGEKGMHPLEVPAEFQAIQSREFVKLISGMETEGLSCLDQGVECQKVLEAAVRSVEEKRYIFMSEFDN